MADRMKRERERKGYRCAALEEDGLMAGALAEGKSADGLCRFVFEAGKELGEGFNAKTLEEPFS